MTKVSFAQLLDENAAIVKSRALNAFIFDAINAAGIDSSKVKPVSHRGLKIHFCLFSMDREDFYSCSDDVLWDDVGVAVWPKLIKPRGYDWLEYNIRLNYEWFKKQSDPLAAYLNALDVCLKYLTTEKKYTFGCLEIPDFWSNLHQKATEAKSELTVWENRVQGDEQYLDNDPVIIL